MDFDARRLDAARASASELENHLVDALLDRQVSRREFVRRAATAGMSLSAIGAVLSACGGSTSSNAAGGSPARRGGGTMRVAMDSPTTAINPVLVNDGGGTALLLVTGEALCYSNMTASRLEPMLATKWTPNHDASAWTFKLRKGVKFSDGRPFTADDVVYTFDMHTDPKVGSAALSTLQGVLSKGNTEKIDPYTVRFHLDSPNGSFPYMVSTELYNAIIIPKGYDPKKWESSFIGTGPFKLNQFTPKRGATFVRNPHYWGNPALPDALDLSFYTDKQAQVVALLGKQVDIIQAVPVKGSEALLSNPNVDVLSVRSAAQRMVHMRVDTDPVSDKRVRQAIALTLDRPGLVKALYRGQAMIGNDSPFAEIYPSTDKSVPQRQQDLAKARALLDAAGKSGISLQLTTQQYQEIPEYAQFIQAAAKQIGVQLKLQVMSRDAYFGDGTLGKSQWLDSTMGIVDYGHRSVPNVYLQVLTSKHPWNAPHFKNPEYDGLVKQFVGASDVSSQQAVAGKIEQMLLDETPVIWAAFTNILAPMAKGVKGFAIGGGGQIYLKDVSKA
jgi:peptide/nickel transport system substrate-binding protein